MDDCIIHSRDVDPHFDSLRRVLSAYRQAGLKLQPDKCQLFRGQVEYLGHLVDEKGVQPVPSYLKVVKEWPIPTTKTGARAFLGKCGYYRRFVRNYAAIAAPWTSVTGKEEDPKKEKSLSN